MLIILLDLFILLQACGPMYLALGIYHSCFQQATQFASVFIGVLLAWIAYELVDTTDRFKKIKTHLDKEKTTCINLTIYSLVVSGSILGLSRL